MNVSDAPWERIHHFLLECGSKQDPKEFCVTLVNQVRKFVPFDQSRIYFVNDSGKVYHEILFDVEKSWTAKYHAYYSKIAGGNYTPLGRAAAKNGGYQPIRKARDRVRDWTRCQNDEFINDYLRPQGLTYSLGIPLHDPYGTAKSLFIFDRTSKAGFSDNELTLIDLVFPHLDNLHRNFHVSLPTRAALGEINRSEFPLTSREAEIANLLCQGLSPALISQKLCITSATVYKHISHIHAKLNVSSTREMLVKLMR